VFRGASQIPIIDENQTELPSLWSCTSSPALWKWRFLLRDRHRAPPAVHSDESCPASYLAKLSLLGVC